MPPKVPVPSSSRPDKARDSGGRFFVTIRRRVLPGGLRAIETRWKVLLGALAALGFLAAAFLIYLLLALLFPEEVRTFEQFTGVETVHLMAVPEPSRMILLWMGALALIVRRRRHH